MSNKLLKFKYCAIFLTGAATIPVPAIAAMDWSIISLGTLGGTYSTAQAVNDSGQVVGNGSSAGRTLPRQPPNDL